MTKNEAKRNLIYTHGDGDGICAGAIAHQFLTKRCEMVDVVFSQPFDLNIILEQMTNNGNINNYDAVFFIDLAFKPEIEPYLEALRQRVEVTYIDHHVESLAIQGRFKGVISTDYSASMLCSHYFNILTPLGKLGSVCDKKLMVTKDDDIFEEAELLRKSITCDVHDDAFRRDVLLFLSYTECLPSEFSDILNRAEKSDDDRNKIMEMADKNILYGDDTLTIIDLHGVDLLGHAGSVASHYAIDKKGVAFVLYGEEKTVITGRSHKGLNHLHIGSMMKKYNGGGHMNAGSGVVEKDEDTKALALQLKETVYEIIREQK